MSGSSLEQIRVLLEEVDALEQELCTEVDNPKRRRKLVIEQEHRILAGINASQRRAKQLVSLLDDRNHSFSREVAEMKGDQSVEIFYKKLDSLNAFYHKYPDAVAQANPADAAKQEMTKATVTFSGAEYYGKYFDMYELHYKFLNLSCIRNTITDKLSYTQYLNRISVFHDIPSKAKVEDPGYKEYLEDLRAYLISFLQRTQPLADHSTTEIESNFEKDLKQGEVSGWETLSKEIAEANSIDLTKYSAATELEGCGANALKSALKSRGLKSGGSLVDLAKRLYSVKGLSASEIPRKLLAKGKGPSSSGQHDAQKAIAKLEYVIIALTDSLITTLEATKQLVTKKLTSTFDELQKELAADEAHGELSEGDLEDDDEADDVIYNPLDIPLGFDGKPIPYWLFKLHGLDKSYDCEICGNYTYRGRRAFDRHFQEGRHAQSMRILGIPNTKHFQDVTRISDAKELYEKLTKKLDKESFVITQEEQFEDSHGNVMTRRVYEDLRRQGIL